MQNVVRMTKLVVSGALLAGGLIPSQRVTLAGQSDDYCPREVVPQLVCEDDYPCHLIPLATVLGECWGREQ